MQEKLRASPDEVAKYLKGIQFPTNKQDLIDTAKKSKAPYPVVRTLEIIKPEKFDSIDDVKEGVSRVLRGS